MEYVNRTIEKGLKKAFFKGKIVIIYGARQVGKTTLVKKLQSDYDDSVYFNCDEPDVRSSFENKTSDELLSLVGNKKVIIIDEAQRVRNIGLSLKLLADNLDLTKSQVLVTGSSSFDLSNEIKEPLTGRKIEFRLYPLSYREVVGYCGEQKAKRLINKRVIYGMYPDIVFGEVGQIEEDILIKELAESYVYKDVLSYEKIRKSESVSKLLQALALQVGNQVSYLELSSLTGLNAKTVESYIDILEKSFVVFRLGTYSRNLRNELKKNRKIYFYDTGIRNALINNFNDLDKRVDAGALWENFIVSEMVKKDGNGMVLSNFYFWRTFEGKEIDLIEEKNDVLKAYEIKYGDKKVKEPKLFLSTYPGSEFNVVKLNNFEKFL